MEQSHGKVKEYRVTEIIGTIFPMQGNIPAGYMSDAANYGLYVHDIFQEAITGEKETGLVWDNIQWKKASLETVMEMEESIPVIEKGIQNTFKPEVEKARGKEKDFYPIAEKRHYGTINSIYSVTGRVDLQVGNTFYDYKTTRKLDIEKLSLQLSIYAGLAGVSDPILKAVHIDKSTGECKLVDIPVCSQSRIDLIMSTFIILEQLRGNL